MGGGNHYGGNKGRGRGLSAAGPHRGGTGGRSSRPMDMSVDLDFALRRKEPFSRIHDMIAFMAALDNAPPAVINEFLMLFTREPHITDKLTCILELRFTPSTFQQVAKPLLALLASTTLVHSPHASDVRALLRLVWSCPLFFKRTMDCLNDPQLLSDVKHDSAPHFAALLLLLVKKLPSVVPLDDMCYDLLGRFRDWGHQNLPTTSGVVAMLNEAMELCEEFVPSRAPHDKVAPAAPNYFVNTTPRPVRRFVEDGDTAIGPRHDNDKPNVDDIQVLPTDDEMRCAEEPYLPLHPDSPSDAGAHVAFHFRAMREDALAQMRRGLQWWLHPSTDRFVPPPRHSDKPRLNVAVQVSLRQVHGSIHKGVLFQVRGPQPWPHETKANLTALWERDRRYAVGSLVCIATEVTMSPEPDAEPGGDAFPRRAPLACHSLVFGTVAVRDTSLLVDPDGFCISIKLIRPTEVPRIMRAMSHGLNVLLEVQNSFFTGYEPILRSLQAHDVAPRLRECLYGTDPAATWTQRPAYLTRTHLQLQCLVHPDHQHDVNLRQVPAASKDGLAAQLRAVMDKLVLDASQIDAFAAAMTQQMCLIQGPPGTGKSYVGTRIVDGILAQTGVTVGPILVVCYTNHALDQFLEGLLDDHIARPLDIVRVGSRSKSARLDECTLFHLRKMEHFAGPTRLESATHGKLVRTCRDIEERTFSSFHQDTALAKFLQWLAQSKTESFEGICGPVDDEDGFHVQGGHKAQEKLFKKWEQGGKGWSSTMWKMNKPGRQALLRRWRHEFVETCSRRTLQDFDVYQECVTKAAEIQTAQNLRLLGRAKIVGMTTTGCALNQELVRCLAPKVVLCEEAGEVLEAHLLSCLTAATEHVIQIGDHKQLRPLVSEFKLSIDANNGFNLDVSMFERLVQTEAPVVTLNTQRRMSRDVCDLIRWTIYPTLEDAPNVLQYPAVLRGFSHSLWFLDHSFQESDKDGSKTNADEASMVVELVQYALRQGFCDVAVLTPYLGQLVVLRNELNTKHVWTELGEKDEEDVLELDTHSVGDDTKPPYRMAMKSLKNCVKLATVDNFQGNEAELVIVSTVRSNARGSVGFLKILNRVNVMLSRAKHGMIVLGSASTIRANRNATMFNNVLDILESKQLIGPSIGLTCQNHSTATQVASAKDMRRLVPDGGCRLPCDARLPCGHVCAKCCHSDDRAHVTNQCREKCTKAVGKCGHLCRLQCFQACECRELLPSVDLSCGHIATNVPCIHRDTIQCKVRFTLVRPDCGHNVVVDCATAIAFRAATSRDQQLSAIGEPCTVTCGRTRPCSHTCTAPCHACVESQQDSGQHVGECTHPCNRMLICGHACAAYCHPANECPPCQLACSASCIHSKCALPCKEPCVSCAEPCMWTCSHRQERCPLPCGSPCIQLPCDVRCPNLLECGHQCPGLCGEPCNVPCRHCASADLKHQVVDLILQLTLEDHDPNDSPLVALPCGHSFSIETLDGYLELDKYYRKQDGVWTEVAPLSMQLVDGQTNKSCPQCRHPIDRVNRYGRILHFHEVYASERKYLHKTTELVLQSQQRRQEWTTQPNPAHAIMWLRQFTRQAMACSSPGEAMAVKERHCLEQVQQQQVNLNTYRNTMQSATELLLNVELLEVHLVCVAQALAGPNTINAVGLVKRAKAIEASSRALCAAVSSHRTEGQVLVLALKLRLLLVGSPGDQFADKPSIVDEMKSLVASASSSTPNEFIVQATKLVDAAKVQLDKPLTQAEKDEIYKVFAASSTHWNSGFGGHWYQCPNGHPYVITECGGAMQVSACPECGAAIGGSNHALLPTNQAATSFFTST